MDTAIATRPLEAFTAVRALLYSIAYRMLGSAMEAEDVVQEAYLRWREASDTDVRSHRAYLVTIVTRLSINQLRSARVQRETYVGPWLPEPVVTEHVPDVSWRVELAESLSLAFLVLLERLSPIERAVFLLHDAFEFEYAEIAAIVEKSEANCRQILGRAKKHIGVPGAQGVRRAERHGQPGVVAYEGGKPRAAMVFDTLGNRIQTIYIILNPDKLPALPDTGV